MFFEQDRLQVKLLDVVTLDQGKSDTLNRRGYHALSLRLEADTRLTFGEKTVYAAGGTVGYFPANLSYRRQTVRDRMIVIHFDTDGFFSGSIEILPLADPRPLQALFEETLCCWQTESPDRYYRTTACFYRILAYLRQYSAEQRESPVPKQILPALLFLDEHFTEPAVSIGDAAAAAHISEVYFRKLFRQAMSISPREYLIGKRISYAISLLESRCLTVRQVAEQAGFTDPKYFSTVFKKQTGVSPRAYLYHWEDEVST